MKTCTKCKSTSNKFWKNQAYCVPCQNAYNRAWYKENHAKELLRRKNNNLKRTFGITLDDYYVMLKEQGGGCKICGKAEGATKKLDVDHCHTTGRIRGLLCENCNRGLGLFYDNPDRLRMAADYLS